MTHFKNDKNKTLFLAGSHFYNWKYKQSSNMVLIGVFRSGILKKLVNAGHMFCITHGVVWGKFKGLNSCSDDI